MAGAARAVALAVLCLLSACKDEPDFDERYEAAEDKIRQQAAEIDRTLAQAERERGAKEELQQPQGADGKR